MAYFKKNAKDTYGKTLHSITITSETAYLKVYDTHAVTCPVGSNIGQQLPAPTNYSRSITIGDVMYSGTDTCSNATYTANSTAKMGGTTAKNKGSFTFSISGSNVYSFPPTYVSNGVVRPESIVTIFLIKY